MAAPAFMSIADMSGTWAMNRSLSGDTDKLLELQSISWMIRKVLALTSITLSMTHKIVAPSTEHIHIDTVLTGGFEGGPEDLYLDDAEYEREDDIWGNFTLSAKKTSVDNLGVDDEFLKDGFDHKEVVYIKSVNDEYKWTAIQVWGFETINGERRYVRHIRLEHRGGVDHFKIVYDYRPQLA